MNLSQFERAFVYQPALRYYLPLSYMDGPSGAPSMLEHSHNGRAVSVAGALSRGRQGWYFDSTDDYLAMGTEVIGAGDITVVARIQALSMGQFGLGRIVDNGKFVVGFNAANALLLSSNGTTNSIFTGTDIISLGSLTFVGTRTSSGYGKVYVNGRQVVTGGNTGTPAAGLGAMQIGRNPGAILHWHGLIKCVILFNRVLSPGEIANLSVAAKEVFP